MNERIVAGRTEEPPDMREKGKHGARSAGFMERRVIVHRSADRGAVSRRLGRSRLVGFLPCLRVSVPLYEKKLRLVLPSALQKIPQNELLGFISFFLSAFFLSFVFHLVFLSGSISVYRSVSQQHHVVAVVSGQ